MAAGSHARSVIFDPEPGLPAAAPTRTPAPRSGPPAPNAVRAQHRRLEAAYAAPLPAPAYAGVVRVGVLVAGSLLSWGLILAAVSLAAGLFR